MSAITKQVVRHCRPTARVYARSSPLLFHLVLSAWGSSPPYSPVSIGSTVAPPIRDTRYAQDIYRISIIGAIDLCSKGRRLHAPSLNQVS